MPGSITGGTMIVFPNARVRVRERVRGVLVASLSYLPKYLERRPHYINSTTTLKAYQALMGKSRVKIKRQIRIDTKRKLPVDLR
jgi:hypothetical protein